MTQPRPTDPIASIGWTERTGGVLTARECLSLAGPLLRGELGILVGRLAMALRLHSGRRSAIDPASLVPPDSSLARDADVVAHDLLTPALLNHSRRAYARPQYAELAPHPILNPVVCALRRRKPGLCGGSVKAASPSSPVRGGRAT